MCGLLGFAYALGRWRDPVARYTIFLTLLSCGVLAVYVFQAARLMAAPAALLGVFAAVAIARGLDRFPGRAT
jgi:hypothetical protein